MSTYGNNWILIGFISMCSSGNRYLNVTILLFLKKHARFNNFTLMFTKDFSHVLSWKYSGHFKEMHTCLMIAHNVILHSIIEENVNKSALGKSAFFLSFFKKGGNWVYLCV